MIDRAPVSNARSSVASWSSHTRTIGEIPVHAVTLEDEKAQKTAKDLVLEWVAEFEHERQRLVQGTAYAALQAVTHWADHGRNRARDPAADRPTGRGAGIKAKARELALAVVS